MKHLSYCDCHIGGECTCPAEDTDGIFCRVCRNDLWRTTRRNETVFFCECGIFPVEAVNCETASLQSA